MASPPKKEGPDASSLKSVSSLLSKFENMRAPTDSSNGPPPPPGRTVSPAAKPAWLRDTGAKPSEAPAAPPRDLKAKPKALQSASAVESLPSPRLGPPPPLSPRPVSTSHPSFLVQPPQSPPKGKTLNVATGEQPAFLNTDSVAKATSPSTPNRPFKIPSRPHTPTHALELRRSPTPRLTPSQPPSPPPPRRSAELKRDREQRDAKPVPPPINRAEKPSALAARNSYFGGHDAGWSATPGAADSNGRIADKVSPFSSPPSSTGSADLGEVPPLPARPRAVAESVPRPNTIQVGFDPPPLHPSIANKRRERELEMNGAASRAAGMASSRGPLTPQGTGDQGPPLPTRPKTVAEQQPASQPHGQGPNGFSQMRPPPRPPNKPNQTAEEAPPSAAAAQKRVLSNPVTIQPPSPPRRTHPRSMTVDRTSSRVPSEFRAPPAPPTTTKAVAEHPPRHPEPATEPVAPAGKVELVAGFPDSSRSNRRPPFIKQGTHEIATRYESRIIDTCGELVCTSGHLTRVWSLLDGELLMSLSHGDTVKATAVAFRPGANVDEEGARLWIGTNAGELMEADIMTQSIVTINNNAHGRHEIIRIYRHYNELWTLDEAGTLNVWAPGQETFVPSLEGSPDQTFRAPKGHTFSMVVGDELWHATGKEVRVFLPTTDRNVQFQVLVRALYQEQAGEISSGTLLASDPDKVFLGHADGKVSIYSRRDYSCLGLLNVSSFKINTLAGVGKDIWAGFNTGRMCVYDISQSPWVVKKEWKAHDNPVVKIIPDRSSFWKLDRSQVVSLGADNMVKAWDGLLQEDFLEEQMQAKVGEYSQLDEVKALIMTWNAGASTPSSLRHSGSAADAGFIQQLLQTSGSPDILVFGFQELVDLEDKTATAKRFLKVKKKDTSDQERMSHQYRDWRDFLVRSLDDYMPGELYHLLQTSHMVGLFTCIFVKSDLRARVRNLSTAEVKRGMGGLHGNKGAIVVRFLVDDTSLCFINCHLAAGQTQANSRHNDVQAILEAAILPVERDISVRLDNYVSGGDGTMILDHELCLLNGDLNYRIDTMSRDTVVAAVRAGNLAKLLERDQLLVARRRNPAFMLRAFEEAAISFAPTYKYDVGTDNYDSSEKKRSPAWCDRLLHRGPRGRISQLDYRRHEVRVSDHRPVSGRFRFLVKRIEPRKRADAWNKCQHMFEDNKARVAHEEKLYYLTRIIGYDEATSRSLIQERSK